MIGKANNADSRPSTLGIYANSSMYGSVIPSVFGRTRSPLSAIWANDLKKHSSGKKAKKKGVATYSQAVDFLLGTNPIISPLRFWVNNGTTYDLTFTDYTFAPYWEGGPTSPTITWTDVDFFCVLGVTMAAFNQATVNDYGDPAGSHYIVNEDYLGGQVNRRPLWNLATAGPDPGDPSGLRNWPFCYHWQPGDGPSITIPALAIGGFWSLVPGLVVRIYYAKKSGFNYPMGKLRLTFEPQLGDGSQYGTKYASQQIIYPAFAGVGSPNLDLGAAGVMPDIKMELLGSYPLYATGDCDFADMVEDIFKASQLQAAYGLVKSRTRFSRGLQCYEFPGCIQKLAFADGYLAAASALLKNPVFYLGGGQTVNESILIVAASADTGWTTTAAISDDFEANWAPVVGDQRTAQRQLWFANSTNGALVAAQDVCAINFNTGATHCNVTMLEIAGVQGYEIETPVVLQSTAAYDQTSLTNTITTTNLPDYPCYILSWLFITNPSVETIKAGCMTPAPPLKELVKPNDDNAYTKVTQRADYLIVKNPGTYTFRYNFANPACSPGTHEYNHIPTGTEWTWVLIAFKATQPAAYSKPLGNILDKDWLEQARLQCRANGLYGSLCMDSQKPASSWLSELYAAMNTAPVWSGFKLKSIPYSEVSCIGNGALYVSPATSPGLIADLATDDFLGETGKPMVKIAVKGSADCQNVIQLQHPNRASKYVDISASLPDTGAVAQNGARTNEQLVFRCVQDDAIAQMLLGVMSRRANVLDKTYKFKLNARWKLLEPMDILTITDLLVGIDHLPIRLVSIDEDAEFNLDCEAEAYIWGLSSPKVVTPTTHTSNTTDLDAIPALVNAPIFIEATGELGNATQAQLWIVISSGDEIYGGCQVFVSTDGGTSYSLLGLITGNAQTGVLAAEWPTSTDPDTTNDLAIDLTESLGELLSYAEEDEDAFTYPIFVEGATTALYELASYAVATLTATNKYTLEATGGNHLRRGILGSTIASHAAAKRFAFLDPTGVGILKVALAPAWIGQTLKFNFAAVNAFGGGVQALADCTEYSYAVTGAWNAVEIDGGDAASIF